MKRKKMHTSTIESLPETKTVHVGVKLQKVNKEQPTGAIR